MVPLGVIITAFVGLIASIFTAYITHRFTVKRERLRFKRNVALKLAEMNTPTALGERKSHEK